MPIPRDPSPESSLALLQEGYTFMANRRRSLGADTFTTRLMLRNATCITGQEAAEFFYSGERFTRRGAMPPTTLRLLQDKGSVQQLDGDAFRHRKQMFMSVMTEASIESLGDAVTARWLERLAHWPDQEAVVLHDDVQDILCRAVCDWAGIPLAAPSARRRVHELGAMLEGAGSVGPKLLKGLALRARNRLWARSVIERIRRGHPLVPGGSPAHVIAWHRDLDGRLLAPKIAAIELINLLRPTVAVARFVTFAALALHDYPHERRKLLDGDDKTLERFVQEVRRFYPFFPFMGGRARTSLIWRGQQMDRGTWVLLDAYGTNHDERIWNDPEIFRPDRFREWNGSAYNFIPQGGGDFWYDHRCPGEWATIAILKRAVHLMIKAMSYDVPPQDLGIDLSRMPALPASGFLIRNVRPV